MKIKVLKGDKIYQSVSPAEIIHSEKTKVLRIKMSCGGGMGGSSWYETVEPVELTPNSLVEVHTIQGEDKLINTSFVVEATEKQLFKTTEIHQNHNFRETMGIPLDYYYLAPLNMDVSVINRYKFTDEWCY